MRFQFFDVREEFLFVRQAALDQTYKVTLKKVGGSAATFETEVAASGGDVSEPDTNKIAEAIIELAVGVGAGPTAPRD